MAMPPGRHVPALLFAVVALAACGTASKKLPAQTHGAQPYASQRAHLRGRPAHIAVIVMENTEYGDIIGDRSAPFINSLARRYALATRMYAIRHPSLPNYLALTGGSTFGIDSDCTDCGVSASGLAEQLDAAGVPWKAYMQDMPSPCFKGASAGGYAKKHNPFIYYRGVAVSPGRCSKLVPFGQLSADERAGRLPRFIWITPNLCNDMHDCSVATGDRFLSGVVPGLLRRLGHHGLLFLTWDEGSSDAGCCGRASGGHIATLLAGPGARRGFRFARQVDHYSVLQTIEDLLKVRRLRDAACRCTGSLAPMLVRR
jgi:hypothetical protein